MTRRAKAELFEDILRYLRIGTRTISGVATKYGVHWRTGRQASAVAPPPKC